MAIGLGAGGVAVAGLAAVAAVALLGDDGTRPYTLTAPPAVAGLPLDSDATKSLESAGSSLEDYERRAGAALGGEIDGRMFAVYSAGADGLRISLDGRTGSGLAPGELKSGLERLARESNNPIRGLRSVAPGPHGGSAVCTVTPRVGCAWLTSTTFVLIDFRVADEENKPLELDEAVELLHRIRAAVEKPA
ncbi:hypothetical protein [Spirillospora albida]|uniref:hypothetical protein n=1 Tax=Spirillospora albida TaxID=58123 RepID=UPI0004BEB61E|nr:hypothetical protein [Spirillospora albida]